MLFFVLISVVRGRKKYLLFVISFLISFAYALSDEIHQSFLPWRFCDIFDIYVDTAGIVVAIMFYLVILLWRE
ncbi:MAG: VanZ family protein [Candidatus Pacearchaeota archaeon]|nr:VanZ family protein [Candidatus Pacearchaeota archaeon]